MIYRVLMLLAIIVVLSLVLAASYGLARAGEPSSAWLWCTVAKLCQPD